MARKNWNRWFFASRRGQIITLLRRSSRTVDELAQVLGLTHTAVRAHLAALERDGLVQQRSERRGGGKPSLVYDLTPAAEYLFPKSYAQLLDVPEGRFLGPLVAVNSQLPWRHLPRRRREDRRALLRERSAGEKCLVLPARTWPQHG